MKVAKEVSGKFESRKVLVVEDDPLLRSLIADGLKGDKFSVSVAASAAEAKRVILEVDPDVALLDIELGNGPTGLDLAEYIATSAPHMAIVFLTHLPDPRFAGQDASSIPKPAAYTSRHQLQFRQGTQGRLSAKFRQEIWRRL